MAQIALYMWSQVPFMYFNTSVLLYIFFPLPEILLCLAPFFNQQIHIHPFKMSSRGKEVEFSGQNMEVSVLKPWWEAGTASRLYQLLVLGLGANCSAFLSFSVLGKRRILLQGTVRIK